MNQRRSCIYLMIILTSLVLYEVVQPLLMPGFHSVNTVRVAGSNIGMQPFSKPPTGSVIANNNDDQETELNHGRREESKGSGRRCWCAHR